jgi:hypothetical protein
VCGRSDRSGRRRGDQKMKHGLGIPETFGTPSSHYAYDSCASGATFQRIDVSPMKTSHNPSSSFLCIRSACEVHEVEKRRLRHRRSADFRVLFAFFDAGNLASPASAHRKPRPLLPERQREGQIENTRCRPPLNLLLPPL